MHDVIKASDQSFEPGQKEYLEGFFSGVKLRGTAFADAEPLPDRTEKKQKLAKEEKIKNELHPLDAFPELRRKARENLPPEPEDIFRFKSNGIFWLAPVHDGYMCRLRIPGGLVKASQFRELGSIARDIASGYVQITTRSNVQIRIVQPKDTTELLRRIESVGLHARGSGADNIRNLTISPTAGIDPHELIDTAPFVRDLSQVIMNDREFYNLPRKFNISFSGGGLISTAEDTYKAVEGDISGVTVSLGVAFNSTFVALVLSIIIMFCLHQLQLSQERLVLDCQRYADKSLLRHLVAN